MSDEIRDNESMEVAQTVTTEATSVAEPVIDWDAAPAGEQYVDAYGAEPVVTYRAPRGRWDFTDSQRIVLALLIWLNLMMLFIGYMAITGRLRI